MFQVKLVCGTDPQNLNDSLNRELSTIQSENVKVKFADAKTAFIVYETVSSKEICCDCQFWDDTQSNTSLMGFCQMCGKRKRFNDKACEQFKDIRD